MAMPAIDRTQLLSLLHQWKVGLINEAQLQETAEAMLANRNNTTEASREDDESVAMEVLLYLDVLPALLVTKDDIDAIEDFLNTPRGRAPEGWRKWSTYWDSIDEAKRRYDVRDNPFYFG